MAAGFFGCVYRAVQGRSQSGLRLVNVRRSRANAISQDTARERALSDRLRLGFRDVQNATNQRAMIIPHSRVPVGIPFHLGPDVIRRTWVLTALVSFPLDQVLRMKMSQNHELVLSELPIPRYLGIAAMNAAMLRNVSLLTAAGEPCSTVALDGLTSARSPVSAHASRTPVSAACSMRLSRAIRPEVGRLS